MDWSLWVVGFAVKLKLEEGKVLGAIPCQCLYLAHVLECP